MREGGGGGWRIEDRGQRLGDILRMFLLLGGFVISVSFVEYCVG